MENLNVIKKKLLYGFIYVEFVKKDGTLRKMWCTRDNKVIQSCGHDIIQFNHSEVKNRERKNPHLLFVYDIQENDTRILNVKTLKIDSLKEYKSLGEVDIPNIKTRFEIKVEVSKKDVEQNLDKDIANLDVDNIFS
jgi:hypothetical protein